MKMSCGRTESAADGALVRPRSSTSTNLLAGVRCLELRRGRLGAAVVRNVSLLGVVGRRGDSSGHRRFRPADAFGS